MSDECRMSPGDMARASRLCELMNDYILNRTQEEKDRQRQQWIAEMGTPDKRCKMFAAQIYLSIWSTASRGLSGA